MTAIKGFIDFSLLDWPGKVSAVLFLPGCNFRCPYCHNHPLVLRPETLPDRPLREVIGRAKSRPNWIDGIVITGGEPTIHSDLPELLREIKSAGFSVKLDTNGSRPKTIERLIVEGLVDHIAMDVKAPLEPELYAKLAGVPADIPAIKKSIGTIISSGLEHTFRTTVVPGLIGKGEVARLAKELTGADRFVLQNFHPRDALDPAWRAFKPMDEEQFLSLSAAADLYRSASSPRPSMETPLPEFY